MKAKLKGTTGTFFDVTEVDACVVKDSIPFVRYFADDEGNIYDEQQLEFESEFIPDTPEKVIEGWVAVDEWGIGGCFLHTQKPHAESREFCDTGDYEIGWKSDGEKYELDDRLFPDMDCESEPKKYRITITPMEE